VLAGEETLGKRIFFFILLFVSTSFAGRVLSRLILGKDKGQMFLEE